MPEVCSCGAVLPPDARFCHKCAKPQRDEPLIEEPVVEAVAPAAPPPPPPAPAAISFRNSAAVRSGFLAALLASLPLGLPLPALWGVAWMFLWLLVSGFVAVWLYGRRTGQLPTVSGGARMGWITGVFCFAIATVFFTINVLIIASRKGLAAFYREQFSAQPGSEAAVARALDLLQSPVGVAAVLLMSLFFLFLLFTAIPTVGGALGAKVLTRD